ncbi:MAG: hypothetical protein M1838_005432 [Thelocarpon superellum]|nr:MAG: hypothetical protein M1838_005432 [Thelocarpon superellum]
MWSKQIPSTRPSSFLLSTFCLLLLASNALAQGAAAAAANNQPANNQPANNQPANNQPATNGNNNGGQGGSPPQGLPTLGGTSTGNQPGTTQPATTGQTTGGSSPNSPNTPNTPNTPSPNTTPTTNGPNTPGTSSASGITITAANPAAPTNTGAPPSITGGGSAAPTLPKDLPTLAGQYPSASVPPTADAPFMQHSNLPEGTVFIAVGAVLGFMALTVLGWRGLVAWSVRRSVQRAALQQGAADSKGLLRSQKTGLYAANAASSVSLDRLAPRSGSVAAKNVTPHTSLFFSPTARPASTMESPGIRGSTYFPAGYYAAGAATPGGGAGMTHVGGSSINLSHLGPQSQGYSRTRSVGPSPPISPNLPPNRGSEAAFHRTGNTSNPSLSSINLSAPAQGRAPSAYLEDLFARDQPPSASREY